MRIAGRNALVTGAAGGIGRASALMLAREGARCVVIADIDRGALDRVAHEIEAAGAIAVVEPVDLSDAEAAIAMYRRAEERSGGLDIIHNNAGIMGGPPDFPDDDVRRMIRAIAINQVAMMIGTRLGVEFMRARGVPGVIVNTSSIAAFDSMPKDPAYAASKRGILAYSESCKPLREEFGIRVVPLCPAVTDTAIVPKDAEWLKPLLETIRLLSPDDIAAAVKRIVEDDSLAGDAVTVANERVEAA